MELAKEVRDAIRAKVLDDKKFSFVGCPAAIDQHIHDLHKIVHDCNFCNNLFPELDYGECPCGNIPDLELRERFWEVIGER